MESSMRNLEKRGKNHPYFLSYFQVQGKFVFVCLNIHNFMVSISISIFTHIKTHPPQDK